MVNIKVLSQAYINSSNDRMIADNSSILCRKVLEKYENEILDNPDGCIFKLTYKEPVTKWIFTDFVSCIEFSAPDYTAYVSDNIYENLCTMNLGSLENVNIELYNPPQATKITFRLSNELLDLITDLKSFLEDLLINNYKFLKVGQYISCMNYKIMISKLKPDNICLINNTDVDVDFEIISKLIYNKDSDPVCKKDKILDNNICNNESHNTPSVINNSQIINSDISNLTIEQLRERRIKFLSNK
mgnify:CR=1 FL=1|tara:strand:+ start:199 stop:930 length:732 start_codon:yes stop_codon:yes gene_type:complete